MQTPPEALPTPVTAGPARMEALARGTVMARGSNLMWAFISSTPLAIARWLEPAAGGVGTHRQLGLPPCTLLYMSGVPCPFCGMTTSWSFAARFEFLEALRTQPMGLVLFLMCAAFPPVLLARAAMGNAGFRPEQLVSWVPRAGWWTLLAGLLVAWLYKAAVLQGWISV